MSLSSAELSTIQSAGVALHRASQTLSDALRLQAQSLVDCVANDPKLAGSEHAFAQFRQLAGICHELVGMEDRLKKLYADAGTLRRTDKSSHRKTAARKRSGAAKAIKSAAKPMQPRPLSPNDLKVLSYLRGILKSNEWMPLTGAIVAAGSGLPKGSVGVSLTRVLASGAVRKGEGGTYQLVDQ